MKFVSVRDSRTKSGKMLSAPAALRQARAMMAVERMQNRSLAKGTSKLSLKEINAEIAAVRKERQK